MASDASRKSRIETCTFINNESNVGGALAGLQTTQLMIENSVLMGNKAADRGGGVFSVHNSCVEIKNCTLDANVLAGGTQEGGAGIYIGDGTEYRIVSNIIVNNLFGEGIYLGDSQPPGNSSVQYNCVFNHSTGNYGGAIPDLTGLFGNISSDPMFVSDGQDNYYLSHLETGHDITSPCVDSGYSDFHTIGTTRIDGVPDTYPSDTGYRSGQVICFPILEQKIFGQGDTMEIKVLSSGKSVPSSTTLYLALQVEGDFWFIVKQGDGFTSTQDPSPFDTDFSLDFTSLQELITIPLPDTALPPITGYWHLAVVENPGGKLYDYNCIDFKF